MASIISKVTELDKETREKVRQLEEERDQLPVFLREQRKEMNKTYEAEAKKTISERKKVVDTELKKAQESAEKELTQAINEIQEVYNDKKDEWIETIYLECVKNFSEE